MCAPKPKKLDVKKAVLNLQLSLHYISPQINQDTHLHSFLCSGGEQNNESNGVRVRLADKLLVLCREQRHFKHR